MDITKFTYYIFPKIIQLYVRTIIIRNIVLDLQAHGYSYEITIYSRCTIQSNCGIFKQHEMGFSCVHYQNHYQNNSATWYILDFTNPKHISLICMHAPWLMLSGFLLLSMSSIVTPGPGVGDVGNKSRLSDVKVRSEPSSESDSSLSDLKQKIITNVLAIYLFIVQTSL